MFQEKHVDLLLIGKGEKNFMFLSKILILACMINHYIVKKKQFCGLQHPFFTEEILKYDIKDCF